jgi:alkylation response protein AidB-like acyl-CoA dehydrogenase
VKKERDVEPGDGMDFDLTHEQSMLVASCERLVKQRCTFDARREQARQLPQAWPKLWADFAELGLVGMLVPQAHGGSEQSMLDAALVAQALGRGWLLEPFIDCAMSAATMLAGCPPVAARDTALRSIASGHKIMVPAHRAGWRGDVLIVEAHHICYADGVLALVDDKLLLALTPGGRKVFWRQFDGTASGRVRCPGASVFTLAEGEQARIAWRAGDQAARIGRIAEGTGLAKAMLDVTIDYLRTRRQFGQPIGRFQALAHRMADCLILHEQVSALMLAAAHRVGSADGARLLDAAQVMAHRAFRRIGQESIQMHGGIGMTDEYQISHCVKRLLAIELEMGDVDMTLRRLVAARHRADATEAANDVGGERGPDTQGPSTSGQQAQADERGADSRGPDSGGPTTGGDAQR